MIDKTLKSDLITYINICLQESLDKVLMGERLVIIYQSAQDPHKRCNSDFNITITKN